MYALAGGTRAHSRIAMNAGRLLEEALDQSPCRVFNSDIKVRVGEIRHSSWSFEYAIDRADGLHCADASTVQVVIGREDKRAQRIPDELKTTLERAKAA